MTAQEEADLDALWAIPTSAIWPDSLVTIARLCARPLGLASGARGPWVAPRSVPEPVDVEGSHGHETYLAVKFGLKSDSREVFK